MCISSVYRKSVADGGLQARSKVYVIETIDGVALAGDGDVLLDQCEMIFDEGRRETVVTYFLIEISARF